MNRFSGHRGRAREHRGECFGERNARIGCEGVQNSFGTGSHAYLRENKNLNDIAATI